jgi:hypothetical protein
MRESFAFHPFLRDAVLTHVNELSILPNVPSSQPDGHKPGTIERGPTGAGKPTHPGGLGEGSRGEAHSKTSVPLRSRLTSVQPAVVAVEATGCAGDRAAPLSEPQSSEGSSRRAARSRAGRPWWEVRVQPEQLTGKPGARQNRFAGTAPPYCPDGGRRKVAWDLWTRMTRVAGGQRSNNR